MAFCQNCGNEVEDGAKFCPGCGNPLDGSAPAQQEQSQGILGDIKKTGLGFKKKMDNYAHGEHINYEKPEGALYFINGLQGTLAVFEDYVEFDFSGSGIKKWQSGFGGVKKVYFHQINSIQKRDATELVNGTLEFELPGMATSKWGPTSENLITYLPKYQDEVNKIYDFVNDKILAINQGKSQPTQVVQNEVSPMAKLKEAKELLDMGVISQEEFDEIKAILGLTEVDCRKIFTINDIPNNGNPVSVDIGYCEGIKSVEITILSARGDNYGLSECEFYACKKEPECINPFIKILVNDNFVYEYVIPEHEKELQLGLYTYGIENPKEQIKIIEGKSKIVNNRLLIDSADQIIILRVEDGSAWDQVVIKKASQSEMKKLESLNRADLKFLKRQRALFRIHNMLYILKHQGVLSVLKRTAKNGVFGTFR